MVEEEIKKRIIWISSSPFVGDGYGKQSHYVCEGLAKAGFDVDFLAWNWESAASGSVCRNEKETYFVPYNIEADNKLYRLHSLSRPLLELILDKVRPSAMVTLGDYQNVVQIATSAQAANIPWYTWFPVDMTKWNLELTRTFYNLDANLVMMSKYGERLAKAAMIEPAGTIPHCVDTEVYKPMNKRDARIAIGLPESVLDRFIIGFVGQNVERKKLDKMVESFDMFARDKQNVLLLAHTNPRYAHKYNPGISLNDWIAERGLDSKYLHTHPLLYQMKYGDQTMAALYNSFNVLILTTSGEGFGLPVLEAAACSVPSIATNCTSMTELIEGHGWLADVATTYDYRGFGRAIVDTKSVARCLQECYDDPKAVREAGERAHEFAKGYDVKITQDKWVKLLKGE